MKINVTMTKDKTNHKSFLILIPKHTVNKPKKILEQMEKFTGVVWHVNKDKTDHKYLAVETGELNDHFRKNFPDDEKAYVNWRMKWKNEIISISTGK